MKGNFSDSMRNRVFVAHDHDEMVEQFHEYYGADCRLIECETWDEYRQWWLAVMADANHPGRTRQEKAEIGRAHVCTPVTNAHLVCRLLLAKKNRNDDHSTT